MAKDKDDTALIEDDDADVAGKDAGDEELIVREDAPPAAAKGGDDADRRVAAKDGEDEDDDDAAHDDDADKPRKRLASRDRRRLQKDARERTLVELAELRAQNAMLAQQVAAIHDDGIRRNLTDIDGRIAAAKMRAEEAAVLLAEAAKNSDGDSLVKALGIRDAAIYEARSLEDAKQRATANVARGREAPVAGRPDPAVQENIRQFREDHDWYNPKGSDADSRVVLRLDAAVAADGYKANTPAYWAELARRMEDALPHRFEAGDDDRGNGRPRRDGGPRGPRLSNGRSQQTPNGRREVYVSADRKAAMIELGVWDDPAARQRYLKSYQAWDRDNAAPAR